MPAIIWVGLGLRYGNWRRVDEFSRLKGTDPLIAIRTTEILIKANKKELPLQAIQRGLPKANAKERKQLM